MCRIKPSQMIITTRQAIQYPASTRRAYCDLPLKLPPEKPKTVNATVARITVESALETAVTPTNQLINNKPIAWDAMAATGIWLAEPILHARTSRPFLAKQLG